MSNQADALYGESRRKAFTAVSTSRAKTVPGQLTALISFFEKNRWTKGAVVRGEPNDYSYDLDGAMMALGFAKPNGFSDGISRESIDENMALITFIRDAATELGYPLNKNWNLVGVNDGLKNKVQLIKLLKTALDSASDVAAEV